MRSENANYHSLLFLSSTMYYGISNISLRRSEDRLFGDIHSSDLNQYLSAHTFMVCLSGTALWYKTTDSFSSII